MGLIANVYRQVDRQLADGTAVMHDCTNGGWSARFNTVCIINAEGPFQPDAATPAVVLVRHRVVSLRHVYAVLLDHNIANKHTMMGGNFLHSSDSRFGELVRQLLEDQTAFTGAVPIHDRIE